MTTAEKLIKSKMVVMVVFFNTSPHPCLITPHARTVVYAIPPYRHPGVCI